MPAGRLTREQLLRSWVDAVDPEYARGVLADPDSAAAIEQACEQLAVVSAANDETTQSLYLLPWSGQSDEPSSGAARSSVTLTVAREKGFERHVVLEPGTVVEEVQFDAGETGGVEVRTGRRYELLDRVVFFPGEAGPFDAAAQAERQGRGYDYPAAGTIRALWAPGKGLGNEGGSVIPSASGAHVLKAAPRPDAPVPTHVGQTVELASGANVGQRRRVVGYVQPTPGADAGGLLLARDALLKAASISPDILPGETMIASVSGAKCRFLARSQATDYVIVEMLNEVAFSAGDVVTGQVSLGSFAWSSTESPSTMTEEVGTAGWRVLAADDDLGVTFANAESPTGGKDATLDSAAYERGAQRAPDEGDEALRERASDPSDAVVPGAVLRAGNRAAAPFGSEVVLREVGRAEMPGLYFDRDPFDLGAVTVSGSALGFQAGEVVRQDTTEAIGTAIVQSPAGEGPLLPPVLVGVARVLSGTFISGRPIRGQSSAAVNLTPTVGGGPRVADKFRVGFSYADMRAYFAVGVRLRGVGEFGCAFDTHPFGFCDSAPALSFFDGFPATSAAANQRVWQSVDEIRPAGSGFTLVEEG